MKIQLLSCVLVTPFITSGLLAEASSKPLAAPDLVFQEADGILAVEAEHFSQQTLTDKRAWYITSPDSLPDLKPDPDAPHLAGASGGAYVEVLPDTRATHSQKLIKSENFTDTPGQLAVLHYKVRIDKPGRYYVWARSLSTGTEDNGLHFGIDGGWPESGQRWQTTQKNKWTWDCRQRTPEVHNGVPMQLFLDIEKPGDHEILVGMREDGTELDKFILAADKDFKPDGQGPASKIAVGTAPAAFKAVAADMATPAGKPAAAPANATVIKAADLSVAESGYYVDKGKWLAINPQKNKSAAIESPVHFADGKYNITLNAVGEEDGKSTYQVSVNGSEIGGFTCPLSKEKFEEGPAYSTTWKDVEVAGGDVIRIESGVGSEDGKEFSRARWASLVFVPADAATAAANAKLGRTKRAKQASPAKPSGPALVQPRQPDGDASVAITGELKQWHKVSLTLNGPFAAELDNDPNPFTDSAFYVTFTHESGTPSYKIPAYFAADGNAGDSSATAGTKWRANLSPDKAGTWTFTVSFTRGKNAALGDGGTALKPYDGVTGSFTIAASDAQLPDFRARGRLNYVKKTHLQFAGDKTFFLKAGADAPETLLGYKDFDGTRANKPGKVPLKSYAKHISDWKPGDPTWQNGEGKGLIGALNYLSSKGMNAFSFIPYNAGGDGDNVWPFVERDDKFHYDCSKLDQWGTVFDHGTNKGLFLHFKLQETENDDLNGPGAAQSLDGGDCGPERKLYLRELIARFGHNLALNWNLGEENTQTTAQQKDMIHWIKKIDAYGHPIVLHTFPPQQNKVYGPFLGENSLLDGLSLQNSNVKDCHHQVAEWIAKSAKAGKPWVVSVDEPGDAGFGMPPDDSYGNMPQLRKADKTGKIPTVDDARKYILWGTILAGGGGVEYYFGYKLPENDLTAEDWRSRDLSWDYARFALEFFHDQKIPFQEMTNRDELIGNAKHDNSKYCLAKDGEFYLVYLPSGDSTDIRLPAGDFTLGWFNPRTGEMSETVVLADKTLSAPDQQDWLAVIRKQ